MIRGVFTILLFVSLTVVGFAQPSKTDTSKKTSANTATKPANTTKKADAAKAEQTKKTTASTTTTDNKTAANAAKQSTTTKPATDNKTTNTSAKQSANSSDKASAATQQKTAAKKSNQQKAKTPATDTIQKKSNSSNVKQKSKTADKKATKAKTDKQAADSPAQKQPAAKTKANKKTTNPKQADTLAAATSVKKTKAKKTRTQKESKFHVPKVDSLTVAACYARFMKIADTTIQNERLYTAVDEWIGTPYRYGRNTKREGTDCSGFVGKVYEQLYGLKLPRSASGMASVLKSKPQSELKEGDIVVFNFRHRNSHVGIYLQNGWFVHASTVYGVTLAQLNSDFYQGKFSMCGEVVREGKDNKDNLAVVSKK